MQIALAVVRVIQAVCSSFFINLEHSCITIHFPFSTIQRNTAM